MLVEIGLMIGAYTIVRLLSLATRIKGGEDLAVVKILAVIAIFIIGFICVDLFTRGVTETLK